MTITQASTDTTIIPSGLPDPEEQLRALAAIHGDDQEDVPIVVRVPAEPTAGVPARRR
ncbi:hypothetical protein WEH80_00365 [Actinomycetes bacterium KLBMP 9759]